MSDDKESSKKKEEQGESSLVIDEKENEGVEDSNDDDNEKEFEPTVEMMMNEFDDERTIEEEEALGQEDCEEEVHELEKEQDMPIEELLKMYGYGGQEHQNGDKDDPNKKAASEGKEKTQQPEQGDTASQVKGEKRSCGSPPPAKKSKSELAKFYESSVEGRSLRSSGGVQEEEEESAEEESDENKDFSWKKTIMIGPSYQASVPAGLSHYDDTLPYENEDKQVWDPSRLSQEVIRDYLEKSAQLQGPSGSIGVNGIPTGSHTRDDEQALLLLLQCGYNVEEALRRKRMNVVPPADTMSLWSEEECRAFETGLRIYGKDFHSIQEQKVGTRSVGELVQFYYLWKKTERHDVFANSFRIEKKKYTLHPGTTDYMERFIDEQEAGRDRSASPNYHSLIYGNVKGKPDISNGGENDEGDQASVKQPS